MPKICVNGIVREMTPDEVRDLTHNEEVEETLEDRLEKLEKLFERFKDFWG